MQLRRVLLQSWLLVAMLWLLGGCVAPDGSIVQFKLVPNGSMAGDAPAEETATSAETTPNARPGTPYPPRPILYMDTDLTGNMIGPIKAVESDGTSLGTVADGLLIGWSHQGDRFAYLPSDNAVDNPVLVVASPGDERQISIEVGSLWTPPILWSSDDTQMAMLAGDPETGFRLLTVDVENGKIADEVPLPADISPYYIDLSPDGQKLILGGESVSVLELDTGDVELIQLDPSFSGLPSGNPKIDWLADSDGVLYLDPIYPRYQNIPTSTKPSLWLKHLGEEAETLLSGEQLESLGLKVDGELFVRLSPSGTHLALGEAGLGSVGASTLLIFDLSALQEEPTADGSLLQPVAKWQLPGGIDTVEWSPDEQALAFLMISEKGFTIEVLPLSEDMPQTVANINVLPNESTILMLAAGLVRTVSWMP